MNPVSDLQHDQVLIEQDLASIYAQERAFLGKLTDTGGKLEWRLRENAALFHLDADELLMFLARRIGETNQAKARLKFPLGRLVNWLLGNNPTHVSLPGGAIARIVELTEEKATAQVTLNLEYLLRLDRAEAWLTAMKCQRDSSDA